MEHVLDYNADVVFLTETWMESDKNDITAKIKDHGYKLLHTRRKNREKETGGGVGIMVRSTLTEKQISCKHFAYHCEPETHQQHKTGVSIHL